MLQQEESVPIDVLSSPLVLPCSVLYPTAVLLYPVVLLNKAQKPTAVLKVPVVLFLNEL